MYMCICVCTHWNYIYTIYYSILIIIDMRFLICIMISCYIFDIRWLLGGSRRGAELHLPM